MACLDNKKNLGVGRCADVPGVIRGIITTPKSFKISLTDSTDQAVWQAALVASSSSRVYLWPRFSDVPEFIGKDDVFQDNPVAYNHVMDGTYGWKAMITKSLCFHKAAFSHFSNDDRVWLIDHKNNLIGTYLGDEADVPQFAGFSADVIKALNMKFSDAQNPTGTPIVFYLSDANEVNDPTYGAIMIAATWINQLAVLTDVVLTVSSSTDGEIVVSVKIACDETPVNGLVAADFVVKNAGGTPITITSVTETGDGIYTLTQVGDLFVTGSVTLDPPASLSVYPSSAYEVLTAGVVTIV